MINKDVLRGIPWADHVINAEVLREIPWTEHLINEGSFKENTNYKETAGNN